jgi:hypothetical protein
MLSQKGIAWRRRRTTAGIGPGCAKRKRSPVTPGWNLRKTPAAGGRAGRALSLRRNGRVPCRSAVFSRGQWRSGGPGGHLRKGTTGFGGRRARGRGRHPSSRPVGARWSGALIASQSRSLVLASRAGKGWAVSSRINGADGRSVDLLRPIVPAHKVHFVTGQVTLLRAPNRFRHAGECPSRRTDRVQHAGRHLVQRAQPASAYPHAPVPARQGAFGVQETSLCAALNTLAHAGQRPSSASNRSVRNEGHPSPCTKRIPACRGVSVPPHQPGSAWRTPPCAACRARSGMRNRTQPPAPSICCMQETTLCGAHPPLTRA